MAVKFTTQTGSVYVVDLESLVWRKNKGFVERLRFYGAGKSVTTPWECPEDWEQDRLPVVGEHLYVGNSHIWWVSTEVVEVEEVTECSI